MEKTIEMVGSKVLCKREVLKLARAEILELNLPFCALGDLARDVSFRILHLLSVLEARLFALFWAFMGD